MRFHRFFIKKHISGDEVVVRDTDLAHQLKNVFRYQVGTQVIIFDGSQYEYQAIVRELSNKEVVFDVIHRKRALLPKGEVWLFMSLIKKDRFEMVVEKATELGVSHIVPVEAERSTPMNIKKDRLESIAREASEQCGRGDVPVIYDVMSLVDALSFANDKELEIYVGDREGEKNIDVSQTKVALFIGPEGGFSEEEKEMLSKNGKGIYLGDFTLRAETAGIVGITRLNIEY